MDLFRKLESNGVSATTGNEKIDKLMQDAILVLRIHLIELQKVASLAEDFHTKYLQALRKRVSHDVLVESTGDSDDDLAEPNRHDEVKIKTGNKPHLFTFPDKLSPLASNTRMSARINNENL
ncbi:unnamed protein product [Cylicostephanus goldi]|uniref:MEIS N-terminal domain-containing protein n=1 Tax=Cylicostephanus goldi TaxID=71465 RepID=A0A3P6QE57_CYLGO|nr:unnamed protein product [Cylicostephanus goldi]